jgi:shikimate kinase
MKIVLIGYMGSGKTSVGKKIAEVLDFPFKDLDFEIEQIEGCSIPEIFSEKGEIYFRKVENKIFKELLQQSGSFVLAIGGGTPCYGDAMSFLLEQKNIVSVYLKTPLSVLVTRLLLEKAKRPLLAHLNSEEGVNDFVRKHLFERGYYYNQASIIVENSKENVSEVAEKIILKLS